MEGVGSYGANLTGVSINALKKAMNTQELLVTKALESADTRGAQMQTPIEPLSEGASKIVSGTLNKGAGLDISA